MSTRFYVEVRTQIGLKGNKKANKKEISIY